MSLGLDLMPVCLLQLLQVRLKCGAACGAALSHRVHAWAGQRGVQASARESMMSGCLWCDTLL